MSKKTKKKSTHAEQLYKLKLTAEEVMIVTTAVHKFEAGLLKHVADTLEEHEKECDDHKACGLEESADTAILKVSKVVAKVQEVAEEMTRAMLLSRMGLIAGKMSFTDDGITIEVDDDDE